MKKILLSFMLMFFLISGGTVFASSEIPDRFYNNVIDFSLNRSQLPFSVHISSFDSSLDRWGVVAVVDSDSLSFYIFADQQCSVIYDWSDFYNREEKLDSEYCNGDSVFFYTVLVSTGFDPSFSVVGCPVYYGTVDNMFRDIIDGNLGSFENLFLPNISDGGTYDPEIGYLQDLEKNFRLLQLHSPGANTAADVDNRVFHFGWSSVTSTGFNLLNNEFQDIRIQVCVTPEAVFRSLFGKVRDLPLGQQKYYDLPSTFPANLLSLDFSVTDLQNDVLSEWFEYLHESQGLLESFNWKFKTYLRVLAYDGTDWYHGGWSQIILNQYVNIAIDSDTEFGVTVSGGDLLHQDSHENPDYDPWVQETDSLTQSFVVGVGSSKEEALNDSYNKYLNSDSLSLTSDNFLQVLISLSKDVGQVPSLLKELFGYLPEYVFSCLGVVIVALCILRLMGR